MTYPVLLRRAAGVVLFAVASLTGIALALALVRYGAGVGILLAFFVVFTLPTLVALVPLALTARRAARGEHVGDALLLWSILYLVAPAALATRVPVFRVPVGLVVVSLVAYLIGTRSKYDPPG